MLAGNPDSMNAVKTVLVLFCSDWIELCCTGTINDAVELYVLPVELIVKKTLRNTEIEVLPEKLPLT